MTQGPALSARSVTVGDATADQVRQRRHQSPLPPYGPSFVASCSHRAWPGRPAKTPLHAPRWHGVPSCGGIRTFVRTGEPPTFALLIRAQSRPSERGGLHARRCAVCGVRQVVAWRCGRFLGQSRSDQAQSARHEGISRFWRTRKCLYA